MEVLPGFTEPQPPMVDWSELVKYVQDELSYIPGTQPELFEEEAK